MNTTNTKPKKTRFYTFLVILIILGGAFQILFSFPLTSVRYVVNQGGTYVDSERAMVFPHVASDSPAAHAGIQVGDYIISIDNKRIIDLETIINTAREKAGSEIEIELERNDQKFVVVVTPRQNPPAGEGPLGVSIINAELKKESSITLVPKVVIQSYLGNELHPFDIVNLWYNKPLQFIRLQSLLFGIAWMVIGIGLLRFKRWAWYSYFPVFLLGWILFFALVNITLVDTVSLIQIIIGGVWGILLTAYIYFQKKNFMAATQENSDPRT